MNIQKRRRAGPKTCGDLFKQGHWTSMIAERFSMSEAGVEVKLMRRIRDLEQKVKRLGGKP